MSMWFGDFFKFARACAAAFVLSGCIAQEDLDSPGYREGFGDGCTAASAEQSAITRPTRRNEALYAADAGYRAGWNSGRATCRPMNGPPRL